MIAFDIVAKVIENDKNKKQKRALGGVDVAARSNFVPTTLRTAIAIGTDYAVGQNMYSDRQNTSENVGIESSWSESIVATIGGELLGGLVSGLVLPSSIQKIEIGSNSVDDSLAATVKGIHSLACAYHGYKRHNDSFLWALGWGFVGNAGLAMAQHFAQPLASKNPMGMNYVRDVDHSLGSDAIENPRKKRRSAKAKKRSSRKTTRVSRSSSKKRATSKTTAKKTRVASKLKSSHKRSSRKISARRTQK